MIAYFDSSVLLSALIGDNHSMQAASWWYDCSFRLSSILLRAETMVVLKRTALHNKKKISGTWLKEKEKKFKTYLEEINIKLIDNMVLDVIERENLLSQCRTLDAIHLATALLFKSASDEGIHFLTFDERQKEIAKELGFLLLS